ncbi:MAG TPA: D-alanyl-D-alanine carboxypeptidase [Solirubrobacteraceae bacterium]|nr:D-alanyl-D-alanine carboxypeptidase [Solirubrobacteraceae bacterium]
MVAITLALVGTLSHTSNHDAQFDAGSSVVAPVKKETKTTPTRRRSHDPALLTTRGQRRPVTAAEARLQSSLTKAMSHSGRETGALVFDLNAQAELFGLRPTVKRPPASVEKLWTTAAIMVKLGPNARLHTTLLGTGSLHHGVWRGNLYLRGGGDPTFGDPTFNHVWNFGNGPTANQLVEQLHKRGITRITGRIYADESIFDRRRGGLMTGYQPDVPDFGGQLSALTYDHGSVVPHYSPAVFAARQLALTMRGSHIDAKASRHARVTPDNARVLATVRSPPLSVMTRLMDVPSDDLFAELFTKQLGLLFGRGGSISDGAKVIGRTIADTYGLHPTIHDGSGLARSDRSSPLEVVDLLREVWGTRVGRELVAALPTVGKEGTVRGYGLKSPAVGNCVAKTGTLNYVTNLAGYCHARGGHTLAFALFIDGPDNGTAATMESRMVGSIARY